MDVLIATITKDDSILDLKSFPGNSLSANSSKLSLIRVA